MKKNKKENEINVKQIIIVYSIFIFLFVGAIMLFMNKTMYEGGIEKYESPSKNKMNNQEKRDTMFKSIKNALKK